MASLPAKLTWQRWWMIVSRPSMTLLRILEYECIQGLDLKGTTLDVGGGRASAYSRLVSTQGEVQAVNLDPHMEPTFVADLNYGIPVAPGSYSNIISLNTLEHIWHDSFVLREMARVLEPGGNLYILVPFLYRVHGSPGDYHRHTASFWAEMLEQIGFPRERIEIESLGFGPLAAPLSLVEFAFPSWARMLLRATLLLVSMMWARLHPRGIRSSGGDSPLGYFIRACK
jgi:SAM-dependent methyltransferase